MKFFWPHIANDIYHMVDQCSSCARIRNQCHHKHPLQLFPPSWPLDFVAMDILGPLPKTSEDKQYVLTITDRYSKPTHAIPSSQATSTLIVNIFFDQWIISYGIRSFQLTDNDTKFVSKFFATLCSFLGVKHLTTTAYHPQPDGQAERFNKTVITRPRHYVAEHQHNWDTLVKPLTYAYNTQGHESTYVTPYSLVRD